MKVNIEKVQIMIKRTYIDKDEYIGNYDVLKISGEDDSDNSFVIYYYPGSEDKVKSPFSITNPSEDDVIEVIKTIKEEEIAHKSLLKVVHKIDKLMCQLEEYKDKLGKVVSSEIEKRKQEK